MEEILGRGMDVWPGYFVERESDQKIPRAIPEAEIIINSTTFPVGIDYLDLTELLRVSRTNRDFTTSI